MKKHKRTVFWGIIDKGVLNISEQALTSGWHCKCALKRILRNAKRLGASKARMYVNQTDPGAKSVVTYIIRQGGKVIWTDKRYNEYEWTI